MGPGGAHALAKQAAAAAANGVLSRLHKNLYIAENCLAIILAHFARCVPRPAAAAQDGWDASMSAAGTAAAGQLELASAGAAPTPADAERLGSSADLAFFSMRMQETCASVDDLLSMVQSLLDQDGEALYLLNRALKAYLVRY